MDLDLTITGTHCSESNCWVDDLFFHHAFLAHWFFMFLAHMYVSLKIAGTLYNLSITLSAVKYFLNLLYYVR